MNTIDLIITVIVATLVARLVILNWSWPLHWDNWVDLKRSFVQNTLLKIPIVKNQITKEIKKSQADYRDNFQKHLLTTVHKELEEKPLNWEQID